MAAPLKMRRRVAFLRRGTTDDGAGNSESLLAPLFGPVWARLRPINGKEEVLAQKIAGVQPFEATIRWTATAATLAATDVMEDEAGLQYNVRSVQNPDEKHGYLSLIVTRGEAAG